MSSNGLFTSFFFTYFPSFFYTFTAKNLVEECRRVKEKGLSSSTFSSSCALWDPIFVFYKAIQALHTSGTLQPEFPISPRSPFKRKSDSL